MRSTDAKSTMTEVSRVSAQRSSVMKVGSLAIGNSVLDTITLAIENTHQYIFKEVSHKM